MTKIWTNFSNFFFRVGQKKEVTIHRFLTEDTVESRILQLQTKKLELANNVLTGAKRTAANKLTFDDLKMLFDLQKWTKKKEVK